MFPSIVTDPTRGKPPIQQNKQNFSKQRTPQKTDQPTIQGFIFQPNSSIISPQKSNQHGAQKFQLKSNGGNELSIHIWRKSGKETQHIYLSRVNAESETASSCSSHVSQLPNNAPDTYSVIPQLIAVQHEQMSSSRNFALHYPHTPPTSLFSDDDDDEVFTPIFCKPIQHVSYTPNRRHHHLQSC